MEKEDQPQAQNVKIKRDFKLRSSLKRSVRNVSELKDDSMESPDETVGGLRRRVSFAASNTVKPFVNDPVQNTIWDNTYEEIIDHTDSNNTLSTASSVIGIVQSSKGIKIVSSYEETDETLKNSNGQGIKRKCVMSKTITETVDMNYTCQFEKPQQKVPLLVIDTNKTVKGSKINQTMYPNVDMNFTCEFPDNRGANFNSSVNMKGKSEITDMEFTCLFPAQGEVNSKSNIEQTKLLNEDMSLTCVFPANRTISPDSDADGITKYSSKDMSLTCVFPANKELNIDNSGDWITKHSNEDMSLTCVFPANKQLNLDNSGEGITEHSNEDMRLASPFSASRLVNTENNTNQTKSISKKKSVSCVIPTQDLTTDNLSSNRNLFCGSADTANHVSKDDSFEKMCSIVGNDGKLIANESHLSILEEGFSFKSVNLQQDALGSSKTISPLLHFSDGFGSAQKPSFLSNTSIYNTHQLLESRLFHVNDISGVKLMNKSAELISIDKCLESSIGSNKCDNRILNNVEMKLKTYHPSSSTVITMQKCKDTIESAKAVYEKFRGYLKNFSPTKHHVSKLEKNVKRLSLVCASSTSSVSLSNESDEDLQDVEMDNELVVASKHEQIMDVFKNTEPTSLKLMSFEDNDYTFSSYFSAVNIAVTTQPVDGRVVEVKVKSRLNPNPQNSTFFMQNAFLVKHIMNKMQMSNLQLSLGHYFDMLSLLHQVRIITEKCIDFMYEFVKAQREFKTLKMDKDGVVHFNILHTNPPIFWTVEFQMSSPDTIMQDSLKVSSKWSPIDTNHFDSILRNIQSGTDCIKKFIIAVLDFFKRTELRKLKCN